MMNEFKKAVSINTTGEQLELQAGEYLVDVLGGWGVKTGDFSILLKHADTGQLVHPERARWRVQSYALNKRAKRIFVMKVPESAKYIVVFENPHSLKVTSSNLFFRSLFESALPTSDIKIYIQLKT